MPKVTPSISALFHVPERFMRSVQLERDFNDMAALDEYIVTPAMAEAFSRVLEGLRPNAGRRAWRVTGDYGVGKSSFALVLAHLFNGKNNRALAHIVEGLGWDRKKTATTTLWPVLLTGSRSSMVPSIALAIINAVHKRKPIRGRVPKSHLELLRQAERARLTNDLDDLEALIEAFRTEAAAEGAGVLLIVDELGKFLEYAAQSDGSEDIFVLQRMAELATRSGQHSFLLLGILHQGFHAYAEKLPMAARNEWEKVAGRFEEIVFDQPLAHTASLVSGALHLDSAKLPVNLRDAADKMAAITGEMGWLSGRTSGVATLDVARLYPLHPTLLPVLVRFFARFGQHERSLFGFLLSGEPFALQAFATKLVSTANWYRLDDLYDYIRACFGHRLAGASYRSQWLRIVATVDSVVTETMLELRLLKAIAVLNLMDAEDLVPTERALRACFAPIDSMEITAALETLTKRNAVFRRGSASGFRLWPNSSVNLERALDLAVRATGPIQAVSANLIPHLNSDPIMARRHYVERGTLRYFEVRYCEAERLKEEAARESKADGMLVIALSDHESGRLKALHAIKSDVIASRKDLVVSVPPALAGLAPELEDFKHWNWVKENTPELAEDAYGAAEVSRQLAAVRRTLLDRADRLIGIRSNESPRHLFWQSEEIHDDRIARGVSSLLSSICDETYPSAPRISNELLNRNVLSSAAAAARMRLIERLFTSSDQADLGLPTDKAPPEKSIYLSVLKAGGVHIAQGDGFGLVLPSGKDDRLRIGPALSRLMTLIKRAGGDRIGVAKLFAALREPPYGVRDGVSPLLLALILRTCAHELAVYEHGTFLHRFGPSDFMRLVKGPHNFEVQHCQVTGVRLEVFEALLKSFAGDKSRASIDLLDVVKPLCQFAAQLPDYTKKTNGISKESIAVRDVLLSAQEPIKLLFRDLPIACGLKPFSPEDLDRNSQARLFADTLHDKIDELRSTYAALIDRIIDRTSVALDPNVKVFSRVTLALRASQVSLLAKDPRLRTFALRLRDPGLSDTAWAEALGSFLVSKPPSKWLSADEARFVEEAGSLAELFRKSEAAAFSKPGFAALANGLRLNLTRADGEDLVRIVGSEHAGADLESEIEGIGRRLPRDATLRVQLLAELLWRELKAPVKEALPDKLSDTLSPRASA